MNIIPAIDLMDGKVVRLIKGDPNRKIIYSDNPIETAQKWQEDGADRLHIVDLDATLGIGLNFNIIKKIAEKVSIPIQMAGGLRNQDVIKDAFGIANKVVLGTFAFKNKELLPQILTKFGKDRILISVDQLNEKIMIDGWRQSTGVDLMSGLEDFVGIGFEEFLLTSVDRDGTLVGPDIDSLKRACKIKNAKIIASGGISSIKDVKDVKNCGASGVILGKALYDRKISIKEAKAVA